MSDRLKDRTLALAGIFQAAQLVHETAQRGKEINTAASSSIHSVFMLDAGDVEEVYGGADGLRVGLETLCRQLAGQQREAEITRYVVALMFLEKKLSRRRSMLALLASEIQATQGQADYFTETHVNVIARLADLYQKTLSNLKPRILVTGQQAILANPDNANMIRTLLLAGIRSAVLWRQLGGSRWELLIRRKAIVRQAQSLIAHLAEQPQTGFPG